MDPPDVVDPEDRLSPADINGDHVNGTGGHRSASPDDDDVEDEQEDEISAYLRE